MNGKSINVKKCGSEYPLRGENEDLTKRIATYVDTMLTQIHDKIPEQPPLTVAVLGDVQRRKDRNGEGGVPWDLIVNLRQHGIDVGRNPLGKILVLPPEGILGTEYLDLDAFTVHKMLNNVSPCRGMYP